MILNIIKKWMKGRKAEDGRLNIGWKGDKKGQPIQGFLQGRLVEWMDWPGKDIYI